jgi:alpha-N-arabinofuranosidase
MGAEGYAAAVNRFAPAMRKKDPSIRLLACGSGGYDQKWNRTVIDRSGKNFDYISTHHYEQPDHYAPHRVAIDGRTDPLNVSRHQVCRWEEHYRQGSQPG